MNGTANENDRPLSPLERDDAELESAPGEVQPANELTEPQAPVSEPAVEMPPDSSRMLARLEADMRQVCESIEALQARLANLEAVADSTARQVSFLPPQLRSLSSKVEGIAFAIGESRYRAVLLGLLGIYDLVDQALRTLPPVPGDDAAAERRHTYQVLRTQLGQILAANGLAEIPADGAFDPTLHRALRTVPCDDPAQTNRIVEIVRPGFRTEQTILRYAEVIVGKYTPGPETEQHISAQDMG